MDSEIKLHARGTKKQLPRKLVLIVCEGEKTEPQYFESFPVPQTSVKVVGDGSNTLSVVQRAIKLNEIVEIKKIKKKGQSKPMEKTIRKYDEVWCVFDRDSFPMSRVNKAFSLADQHGIRIAFSNESDLAPEKRIS